MALASEELTDQIGQLMARAGELQKEVAAGNRAATEIKAELDGEIKPRLNEIHAEREDAKAREAMDAQLTEMRELAASTRYPSKASLIGNGMQFADREPTANLESLIVNLVNLRSADDPDTRRQAKANLQAMGSLPSEAASNTGGVLTPIEQRADGTSAKATLTSSTGAGAGYLIPNALVTDVILAATAKNIYRQVMQVITGVRTLTIQVPTEGPVPTRAQVVAEGATKTNLGLSLANYTATLYTLAQIFDVSNQLLRHSTGAAEQLVRSRLSRGWALGEAYYILQGSGSSEPKGILTSLGTATGTFVNTPAFTASATTLAGSSAAAIAGAAGTLANRSRVPDTAVVNAGDFYTMLSQGTDSAGFFFGPDTGPAGIDTGVQNLRVFGIRVVPDPNMPTDSMVVGEFGSAQLFIGDDYRIDTSTEAGTRWDTNVTGFRGEEELGFNADPYVASGMFQRVTNFVP